MLDGRSEVTFIDANGGSEAHESYLDEMALTHTALCSIGSEYSLGRR